MAAVSDDPPVPPAVPPVVPEDPPTVPPAVGVPPRDIGALDMARVVDDSTPPPIYHPIKQQAFQVGEWEWCGGDNDVWWWRVG